MARIFSGLAVFAWLLLVAAVFVGLGTGDYNGAWARVQAGSGPIRERRMKQAAEPKPDPAELRRLDEELAEWYGQLTPYKDWATLHILLGVASALVCVLVHSVSVTYFIGTARWVREVVETYRFDPEVSLRADAIKARTFPWSLGGIVAVVGLGALGAAANPGARFIVAVDWVIWHHLAAWLTVVLTAVSFYMQVELIAANYALIDEVIDQVRAVRQARGLPTEEDDATGEAADADDDDDNDDDDDAPDDTAGDDDASDDDSPNDAPAPSRAGE